MRDVRVADDAEGLTGAGLHEALDELDPVHIEEQARGDASKAAAVRAAVVAIMGENLSAVKPGSEQAAQLKQALLAQGAWSQYLEVGIGPDAEVFTKAPLLSALGMSLLMIGNRFVAGKASGLAMPSTAS